MGKRVTFGQMSDGVQQYIFSNQAKVDKLQRQLASGRKLTKPSDDPVGVSNALDLRGALSANGQYHRNVDGGIAYLATIDTTINGNNEFLQRARELGIQGANDTLTAENRGYIAREVRAVFDQMVALSNTNFRGEYVFSGTNTQVPPFTLRDGATQLTAAEVNGGTIGTAIPLVDANVTDSNLTPSGQAPAYHIVPGTFAIAGLQERVDYTVDYVNGTVTFLPPGTAALALAGGGGLDVSYAWLRRNEAELDGVIHREIEQDNKARINTTASDVYGKDPQDNTFAAMITLMDGLVNNKSEVIGKSLNLLESSLNRNLSAQATNGARANQYEIAQGRGEVKAIDLTDLQSKIEDVDFAEAITQLSLQQAVYEASLRMGARALQQTLMDFI